MPQARISWISAVSHHFVGLIPCFSWRNRHCSCIHYAGACTSHLHRVKRDKRKKRSTSAPSSSDVMMMGGGQRFFIFCQSQQPCWQATGQLSPDATKWPVEDTTLEALKWGLLGIFALIWKTSDLSLNSLTVGIVTHKTGQNITYPNQEMCPKVHSCQQNNRFCDGVQYMAQRLLAPLPSTGYRKDRGGWGDEDLARHRTEHHASELCNYFCAASNINLRAMQII